MAACGVCGSGACEVASNAQPWPTLADEIRHWQEGYSRAIKERDEAVIALANVSGALMDAATIPVPEAAQYGNAVRMLTAERDEAVGLLRELSDQIQDVGDRYSETSGEWDSVPWFQLKEKVRAFLAKHPEVA